MGFSPTGEVERSKGHLVSCHSVKGSIRESKLNPNTQAYVHMFHVSCMIIRVTYGHLSGTVSYGLHNIRYSKVLKQYSDTNCISDADVMKATSGYVFTYGGATILWRLCKQTILIRSNKEAELAALDATIVEAECLIELLMDLSIVGNQF